MFSDSFLVECPLVAIKLSHIGLHTLCLLPYIHHASNPLLLVSNLPTFQDPKILFSNTFIQWEKTQSSL